MLIAVGNPARGDDGLGPALLEMLAAERLAGVETLLDFQLQVEHALDLVGRAAVLFIDASRAKVGVRLDLVEPARGLPALSHALTPAGVLHVAQRLGQVMPEAWQLAIEGESFGLGEGLSAAAQRRLPAALGLARQWLAARGVGGPRRGSR